MLKKIASLFSHNNTQFDDEKALLQSIFQGDQTFDVVDNTVNLINNYMEKDGSGIVLLDSIMHAARVVAKEIDFPDSFHELLISQDFETIKVGGIASEKLSALIYTDLDKRLAIMSDCYSFIAVLCYGRLGQYRNTPNQKVFELAAAIFGLLAADEALRKKRGIASETRN